MVRFLPRSPWDYQIFPYADTPANRHKRVTNGAVILAVGSVMLAAEISLLSGLPSSGDESIFPKVVLMLCLAIHGGGTGILAQRVIINGRTDTQMIRMTTGAVAGIAIGLATLFHGQENIQGVAVSLCLTLLATSVCAVYTVAGGVPPPQEQLQLLPQGHSPRTRPSSMQA